jgi:probable RNA-binding protein EIF1AD
MAGLGRRSHYRKHLTDAVLNDLPEPQDGECIAKVVATRGGNQFDVLVVGMETPQLAILPMKFHKLIWVKRGDFCIVRTGDENAKEDAYSGVRYLITHVLYKDQVKHLKAKNLWPDDKQFATLEDAEVDGKEMKEEETKWTSGEEDEEDENDQQDDGIVYDTGYDDDDQLFVNTNRVSALQIQDSQSESSDDD